MKILMLAPYIYDKSMPEFIRNKTGFGIMVKNIANSVGKLDDVTLITRVITEGQAKGINNYKLSKHTFGQVLSSAKASEYLKAIKRFLATKGSPKDKLRSTFYALDMGYVRKQMLLEKPDIVHIHGVNDSTLEFMDLCESLNLKYLVTLHGLNGLDASVEASDSDIRAEQDFLLNSVKHNIPVSVISTGVKKRIEEHYIGHEAPNITVVTNGTDVNTVCGAGYEKYRDLKKAFSLAPDSKICVVIGSMCERKNQMQVVEAFDLLPTEVKDKCNLFLCGTDSMNGAVQKRIEELNLLRRVFPLGFVKPEDVSCILEQTDLNIVASKDEGFGLSIIEAYTHGVPIVTFADLDAIADVQDENVMFLAAGRSTKQLAEAITLGIHKNWNRAYIKEFSNRFSLSEMTEKYMELYVNKSKEGYITFDLMEDLLRIWRNLDKKIIVSVGNISKNKNQIQLVRVMSLLKDRSDVIVVFPGGECDQGELRMEIAKRNLGKRVILTGFCNEMNTVWENANLNVFLSLNDGFGLPIIEGYAHGLPCVFFSDIDAAVDCYTPDCAYMPKNRDDRTVADAIVLCLNREWNPQAIRKEATRFSLSEMADGYYRLFKML